jgi:membrane fusion protein, multidrug efflux system
MTDTPQQAPQNRIIKFHAPKGFPTGPVLAVGLSLGLAVWMSLPSEADSLPPVAKPDVAPSVQSVRTVISTAETVVRQIVAEGESRPLRSGVVSPRISGIVAEILVEKGEQVAEGQALLRLDVPDFAAREREARARLDEATREMEKVASLSKKGLATEDQQAKARTSLAAAEAGWAAIEEARRDMVLRAPFAGTVNDLPTELGDNISTGGSVAEVLDMSSLVVGVSIPQGEIGNIHVGQAVQVSLVTGQTALGEVTFVSAVADSETRSFPVEIRMPNPDGTLKAGVSASVVLDGPSRAAHSIPSAYLSLESSGQLAVKLVNDGVVETRAVEIVSSGLEAVQVTGLPEKAEIITVGQGFVQSGDAVRTEVSE